MLLFAFKVSLVFVLLLGYVEAVFPNDRDSNSSKIDFFAEKSGPDVESGAQVAWLLDDCAFSASSSKEINEFVARFVTLSRP